MQKFQFEPSGPMKYELVESTGSPRFSEEVQAVVDHFRGGDVPAIPYFQTPRMGRACCIPSSDEGFFIGVKGTGPGRSSKLLQAHWDTRNQGIFRRRGTDGGCLQIPSQPPYLILYERDDARRTYQVIQAVPEGRSSFESQLYDFVLSCSVYEPIGISVARSRAVLRGSFEGPWAKAGKNDSLGEWVTAALRERLEASNDDTADYAIDTSKLGDRAHQEFSSGPNLDLGILVRVFRSPFCLEEIDADATKGRWQDVYDQLTLLGEYGEANPWSERLLTELATTAGVMLDAGILHGQLGFHYQDISTAGELRDFDTTLISPYTNPDLSGMVHDALRQSSPTLGKRYCTEQRQLMPTEQIAACRLTGAAYALYSAALRFWDIAQRAPESDNKNGTVLSRDEIDAVHTRFIKIMTGQFNSDRAPRVLEIARNTMSNGDVAHYTDFVGFPTTLGWMHPWRPFSYEGYNCTKKDQTFIERDHINFAACALGIAPKVKGRQVVHVPRRSPNISLRSGMHSHDPAQTRDPRRSTRRDML